MSDTTHDHRRAVALFRYSVIAEALSAPPGSPERRRLLRAKAEREHEIPGSRRRRVALETMRDWIAHYERGGFDALYPKLRADRGRARQLPPQVAELLVEIKERAPQLSVREVIRQARAQVPPEVSLAPASIYRLFRREGLLQSAPEAANGRYLLFPWVRVAHLASHALGLAARQVAGDWQQRHGYRPVLLESYTDPERHRGTCYRAAGWQQLGSTQGRGPGSGPKQVWVRPLQADWQALLRQGRPAPARRGRALPLAQAGDGFVQLWQELIATAVQVAREHDAQWVRRQRALNTLLVMLFVFRLVFAPQRRGYATVLNDLWQNCRQLGVDLPQPRPVSAAAICKARPKVDAAVFRRLHWQLLQRLPQDDPGRLWLGHRSFAVDGSKLNLPRPLLELGYAPPGPGAHYPQGLLSCLFQLYAQLPVDFQLHAHGDERRASLEHLAALRPGDVVVYDRGYYSFGLLAAHCRRGLHAVFRLKSDANAIFAAFIANSARQDEILTLAPSARARQQDPALRPCRLRLVKYTAGPTSFALATTLLEARYRRQDLAALYHGRWSIEELFKVSKDMLKVAPFHGQSERLVKQELYAHFTLIALTRVFADEAEQGFRAAPDGHGRPAVLANFRHSLQCVARQLEGLFLQQASLLGETVQRILDGVAACRHRRRPGRSYERRSRQPANKWRKRTTEPTASQA